MSTQLKWAWIKFYNLETWRHQLNDETKFPCCVIVEMMLSVLKCTLVFSHVSIHIGVKSCLNSQNAFRCNWAYKHDLHANGMRGCVSMYEKWHSYMHVQMDVVYILLQKERNLPCQACKSHTKLAPILNLIFINVPYHILVSIYIRAIRVRQVYDMAHWWKNVLRTRASLVSYIIDSA